jgi:membrane protein implicated in regulation of membrane protease activity
MDESDVTAFDRGTRVYLADTLAQTYAQIVLAGNKWRVRGRSGSRIHVF